MEAMVYHMSSVAQQMTVVFRQMAEAVTAAAVGLQSLSLSCNSTNSTLWTGTGSAWVRTGVEYVRPHYEPPTPEQVRMFSLRSKRDAVRRGAANVKAESLLRSLLTERQDRDLTEHGWFDVPVRSEEGERTYRIHRGSAGNVHLLGPDGKAVERYCAYPRGGLPAADSMAAQKLMLEANERKFLKVANRTRLR